VLFNWPIRVKSLIGLGLLLLLVIVLAGSGLYTTLAYRSLVRGLRQRAVELPLAAELNAQVAELRITLGRLRGLQESRFPDADRAPPDADCDEVPARVLLLRDRFRTDLDKVEDKLSRYRAQLEHRTREGSPIGDTRREWATIRKIEPVLARVHELNRDTTWVLDDVGEVDPMHDELEILQGLTAELPSHLHQKLRDFRMEVRSQYRALIVGTAVTGVSAGVILLLLLRLFYQWVFRPLQVLIDGSRQVAAGKFSHRIQLETNDEMAELAEAMNAMTARFQAIRDDLDRQVRERTQQLVRNEQLASVGFLASGVAHEINNPLASIAMSSESLVGRVREILDNDDPQHEVIANYLRMIQSEAFRCKEITEKLLDFSRTANAQRQPTELGGLVQGVIDMVCHLGKYQKKHIVFRPGGSIVAPVNPQEMKQVVLNLLTNALDSLDEEGTVEIRLAQRDGFAELTFADDGCGMTPDVLQRVFEPFFTRRKTGQGTGLGLSITHRIVVDHGGQIDAQSQGPGRGSTFQVRVPLSETHKETENRYRDPKSTQAAVC
jgi:signal transduction histidine kinase